MINNDGSGNIIGPKEQSKSSCGYQRSMEN